MKQFTKRHIRHRRVRRKISGTSSRPRMAVFRSSKYLQIQLIDDEKEKTIFGFTDRRMEGKTKTERARAMGKEAAKR
ncbi:MAG: 50S ribosomal protein L18, partial [Patescibacteria group bacterium]